MRFSAQNAAPAWPVLAWATVALAGLFAPAAALLLLAVSPDSGSSADLGSPVLAVTLMGAGMIGAAAAGRFWIGLGLALFGGIIMIALAYASGAASLANPLLAGLAFVIASISFAARGALFSRSAGKTGWWIAVFVVAGEAAMLAVAWAQPGALPLWLLTLLPAQWASTAIAAALTGTAASLAMPALLALGGTATATLFVARMLPRRWPYLVMFTSWLALSAYVYQNSPPSPALLHTSAIHEATHAL